MENMNKPKNTEETKLVTEIKNALNELDLTVAWAARQIRVTREYMSKALDNAENLTEKLKTKLMALREFLKGIREAKQRALAA